MLPITANWQLLATVSSAGINLPFATSRRKYTSLWKHDSCCSNSKNPPCGTWISIGNAILFKQKMGCNFFLRNANSKAITFWENDRSITNYLFERRCDLFTWIIISRYENNTIVFNTNIATTKTTTITYLKKKRERIGTQRGNKKDKTKRNTQRKDVIEAQTLSWKIAAEIPTLTFSPGPHCPSWIMTINTSNLSTSRVTLALISRSLPLRLLQKGRSVDFGFSPHTGIDVVELLCDRKKKKK